MISPDPMQKIHAEMIRDTRRGFIRGTQHIPLKSPYIIHKAI